MAVLAFQNIDIFFAFLFLLFHLPNQISLSSALPHIIVDYLYYGRKPKVSPFSFSVSVEKCRQLSNSGKSGTEMDISLKFRRSNFELIKVSAILNSFPKFEASVIMRTSLILLANTQTTRLSGNSVTGASLRSVNKLSLSK